MASCWPKPSARTGWIQGGEVETSSHLCRLLPRSVSSFQRMVLKFMLPVPLVYDGPWLPKGKFGGRGILVGDLKEAVRGTGNDPGTSYVPGTGAGGAHEGF